MNKIYKKYIPILYIIVFVLGLLYLVSMFFHSKISAFSNYNLNRAGSYPNSDNFPILTGDYEYSGNKNVSDENYNELWWYYPIFKVGNFKQITNNLRHWKNPDEGTCIRSEFCGALYHSIKNKSNEINVLPPAEESEGARVGYFRTEPNQLYYSIPTNENILY